MNKNPYDYLRHDFLGDADPIDARASWRITEAKDETITILTALTPEGMWCYGYHVYWRNGRTSAEKPCASRGLFTSQREARLHAIGFFLTFAPYFTPSSCEDLRAAEKKLAQSSFFED